MVCACVQLLMIVPNTNASKAFLSFGVSCRMTFVAGKLWSICTFSAAHLSTHSLPTTTVSCHSLKSALLSSGHTALAIAIASIWKCFCLCRHGHWLIERIQTGRKSAKRHLPHTHAHIPTIDPFSGHGHSSLSSQDTQLQSLSHFRLAVGQNTTTAVCNRISRLNFV